MLTPLLSALALVILAAKLGGWLSSSVFKQPAVLGELLAGLLLGPSLFNLFGLEYFRQAHVSEALREFGELGVIFLMFVAGLEVELADFRSAGQPAVFSGILGVGVPVVCGTLATAFFGYSFAQAVFMGIVMAATSVSISAQTLIEIGQLRSREGLTLLGAAVVDDILAIIVLAIFMAITAGDGIDLVNLLWMVARMLLFLGGALGVGLWLLPRLVRWAESYPLPISEPMLSLVVVNILLFAWLSEFVGGVAAITGAFLVGVALAPSPLKEKIERQVHGLAYAFFVPIFMVSIGLTANAQALSLGDLGLIVVISLTAMFSKLLGAGAGARLGGLTTREAWRVGMGMISRGEVGLIVAAVGVNAGIISSTSFTAIVLMILATTLVTPPLLRWAFR